MIERKSLAWRRPIKAAGGAPLPVIAQVSLIAEAVAAWFDFVIGDSMQENPISWTTTWRRRYRGRTTDVAVFENGELDIRQSGTIDPGVLGLSTKVSRALEDRYQACADSREASSSRRSLPSSCRPALETIHR
jgi:hypothetical protein